MSTRTIYSISEGSYSDYRVLALFEIKAVAENALSVVKRAGGWRSEPFIEEFLMFDEYPKPFHVYVLEARIWDDGSTSDSSTRTETHFPWTEREVSHRPIVEFYRSPPEDGRQNTRLIVRGTDEQAVKQSFSDNCARLRDL